MSEGAARRARWDILVCVALGHFLATLIALGVSGFICWGDEGSLACRVSEPFAMLFPLPMLWIAPTESGIWVPVNSLFIGVAVLVFVELRAASRENREGTEP